MTKMCKFEGCPNEEEFVHLGCCRVCYNALHYWKGRSRADKVRRQAQLVKLNSRMDFMIDSPRSMPRPRKKNKKRRAR